MDDVLKVSELAVDGIFEDLRDRRFLKWLFNNHGEGIIDWFRDGTPLEALDLEVQQDIRNSWRDIIAAIIKDERERSASMLLALKEIAKVTRGDDYNSDDWEMRSNYYSGRFFTAQKTARDAIKTAESKNPGDPNQGAAG